MRHIFHKMYASSASRGSLVRGQSAGSTGMRHSVYQVLCDRLHLASAMIKVKSFIFLTHMKRNVFIERVLMLWRTIHIHMEDYGENVNLLIKSANDAVANFAHEGA